MPIIDLSEAKAHLNIKTTGSDTELQSMVDVACSLVQEYADRSWDDAEVVQSFDGGTDTFLLSRSPIVAIASVEVDGVETDNFTASLSSGIVWTKFHPRRDRQNVVITYSVGVGGGEVPELARQGALEALRHLWGTQRGGMVRQPLAGDEYPTGEAFSLPRRVQELLDPLRAVG